MAWQSVISGLSAGSSYALVAVGFGLIFEVCGFYHLGHGAVFASGAYLTYLFRVIWGLPPGLSILLALAGSALLGVGMESLVYRPMRHRHASSLVLLIVSLGLLVVIQNVISLIFGDATKTFQAGPVVEGINVFGARATQTQIVTIVLSIAISICLWALMRYTKWGKVTRAVATDNELSLAIGVRPDWVILGTFAVGSAVAGIAGILVGYDMNLRPTMGFEAMLMGVVAAIVGGMGSIPGALLGGWFIGLSEHLGVLKLPSQWQGTIVFAILLVFLLLRPEGFLGRPRSKLAD
jgi:branched-chain amino acid transport system permease protein